jgi:amino acid permease
MSASGWLGILLLIIVAIFSGYTGIILGKAIEKTPKVKEYQSHKFFHLFSCSYSEVGEEAFGRPGRILAQFSMYLTLGGVAIIFLILLGKGSLNVPIFRETDERDRESSKLSLLDVSYWNWSCYSVSSCSEILWGDQNHQVPFHMILVDQISWFGFGATASVVLVSCVLSLVFYFGETYATNNQLNNFSTTFVNISTFAIGFSVFTFAFGATAIVRSIPII